MVLVLVLALLLVPIVELWAVVNVAGGIGILPTIALLVLVSVLGTALVRREGVGVLRRMSGATARGELPADELVDGALLVVAGILLVVPGFVTDVLALALLVPPVRALARRLLVGRLRRRVAAGLGPAASGTGFGWSAGRRVDVGRAWIDADARDTVGGDGVADRGALGTGDARTGW